MVDYWEITRRDTLDNDFLHDYFRNNASPAHANNNEAFWNIKPDEFTNLKNSYCRVWWQVDEAFKELSPLVLAKV